MAGNFDGMPCDGVLDGPVLDNRKTISRVNRSNAQAPYASNRSHMVDLPNLPMWTAEKGCEVESFASPYHSAVLFRRSEYGYFCKP